MNETRTTSRKTRVGKVVSDKMDKTVVVTVEDRVTSAGAWSRSLRRLSKEAPE